LTSPVTPTPTLAIKTSITPPPGCFFRECTIACPTTNPRCCPPIIVCASGTPAVATSITPPTCITRPACLDKNPPCILPTPPEGWCQPGQQSDSHSNSILYFLNNFLRRLR